MCLRSAASAALLFAATAVGCPGFARADPPAALDVEIDGESSRASGYSIDGGAAIGPTDLIWVGRQSFRGYLVVRGAEPVLRFREHDDRLFQHLADGREVLVAFRAGSPAPVVSSPTVGARPTNPGVSAPPFGLTAGEVAGLRGLCIDRESPDLDRLLASIDLAKIPVVVNEYARAAVSRLPRSTRYLVLDSARDDKGLVEPMPAFPELRLLNVRPSIPLRAADVEMISKATGLRWLAIGGRAPDLAPLARLKALRVLDLDGVVTGPSLDLSFAASFGSLREVRLGDTRARDLTPLGGLSELESIRARGAPILVLPTGTMPALRQLDVIDTLVPPERAAAFARVRPACAVDRTYRDVLLRKVGAVDAIRIRSGGTCHRTEADEKAYATITEPLQVAEVLASLEFEAGPIWSCMCCGEPTIELLRGGRLVASLGIHHRVSVRWSGGEWGGDAVLPVESRVRLFTLLTAAGVPDLPPPPAPDRAAEARTSRRLARERELLPREVLHVLRRLRDSAWQDSAQDALAELVEDAIPPGIDTIDTCLRLLSQRGDSWLGACASLRRCDAVTLAAHLRQGVADPELTLGAGYWLLRRGRSKDEAVPLPDDDVSDRVIGAMLRDADPDVRLYAIEGLARRGGPIAIRWNRRVLDGFVLTATPDPKALKVAETVENRRAAISTAIRLQDAESLPRIKAWVAAEDASHRENFERELAEAFPKPK